MQIFIGKKFKNLFVPFTDPQKMEKFHKVNILQFQKKISMEIKSKKKNFEQILIIINNKRLMIIIIKNNYTGMFAKK